MLADKFKNAKNIDLEKNMKAYITKHYDSASYTSVETFIKEVVQYRNVCILIQDMEKSYESLKKSRDNIVTYINMLNVLRSKINFGKDNYSLAIEFGWKDTLKNDFYYSYNVNLEYFSLLFNLAVCYNLLGNSLSSKTDDDSLLKEGIKYYQYSAWLFDKIKNEVPTFIPSKEIQPDLSVNYLTYCSYLCQANAQILLLTVAEKKNTAFELQSQLAKGIFELFNNAISLVNESLKKLVDDTTKSFLNAKKLYYLAISCTKMKDHIAEDFKKTGNGYGKQIAYLSLAVQALNVGFKDVPKAKTLIDATGYEALKNNLTALGEEMEGKNTRIYFDSIPEPSSLPKIEKKLMVSPAPIPDDLNNQAMQKKLDELVPKGAKEMIMNYKKQMMDHISQNLNNYENDATILSLLTELNLPYSLETVLSQNEISESLWKRINEVQQKGGSLYLTNNITNLEKKSEEIARRINDILFVLKNEEEEDNKYRTLYGNRWTRAPSSNLNFQYVGVLNDYSKKLEVARKCDSNTKVQIMDNMKYYELLGLGKESLKNKIPTKVDSSKIKDCEEAKMLRLELDSLDVIKEKLMEVINKIFQTLNEDNVIPQFLKVLQGKITEKNVFEENKAKYDEMFKELENLSNEVKKIKSSIISKNEAFLKVKSSSHKVPPENEKFFKDLEEYVQGYNQRLVNLNQGMNFYNEFNTRLNELNTYVTDYLMARDMEKNDTIKVINSGLNNLSNQLNEMKISNNSAPSYLNPDMNTFTNMNYSYHYNPNMNNRVPSTNPQPSNIVPQNQNVFGTQQFNQNQSGQGYNQPNFDFNLIPKNYYK